jgi:hypothetical protein
MKLALIVLGLGMAACSASIDDPAREKVLEAQAEQPDECGWEGAHETCLTEMGASGGRRCEVGANGFVWGACFPARGCLPGESMKCGGPYGGGASCALVNGEWSYAPESCTTPLVLAFEDEPITFTNPAGAFDLAGGDALVRTDWVSSSTPWLVRDRNANGTIDDGAELFGSMTRLPSGERAVHGFMALAPLDADGDGWITASDPAFAELAVWRDLDQDRMSSVDELSPIAVAVLALSLDYRDVPRCLGGSCERERAALVFRDGEGNERRGSVVDVHLAAHAQP